MLNATLRIDGPPLTAHGEGTQIDTVVEIDADGNQTVVFNCRGTGRYLVKNLAFDAYEWERLKKAIVDIDATVARIQERGAVFRVG